MILVLNCIVDTHARVAFERDVVPRLAGCTSSALEVVHFHEDPAPGLLSHATHLLVSGSELSAATRNPRDEPLMGWIRSFVETSRPVLGICYGHQMVARALAGDDVCRRAARPEFGWMPVALQENPLFAGLDDPVFAHSHFDEVTDLPDAFEVIGSTNACAVQAFQLRGRPVWGVQFHPEIGYEDGTRMFAKNREDHPGVAEVFEDALEDPKRLDPNARIFENFCRAR